MALAGGYAIWYGRWELAVYDGRQGNDGVIQAGENLRGWFIESIVTIGAGRIGAGLGLALLLVFAVDRLTRRTRPKSNTTEFRGTQ